MSTTIERRTRGAVGAEADRPGAPELSVIVPLYQEEDNVQPLHERLHAALERLGRPYEIVYVDDGSRDATPHRLLEAARTTPQVRVVRFRRNFGQTAAIQAGLQHSTGRLVILMDGDLQNDPDDIEALLAKLDEGHDVVSGWRMDRHDAWLRSTLSRVANALISRVTGVRLHDYGCTLKAYRREVLDPIRLYGEMHRFIPALVSWAGASITEMPVTHHARQHGYSKYGLSRTFRVLLDLLTVKMLASYSTKPIYLFGFAGFATWALAFVACVVVLVQKLLPPYPYAHNNPLLLLAVFLGIVGMQLILMGLLAELVIRAYHESQDKPTYVVREIIEGGSPERY
ncbi:MAG TPA: glycosyltransferase family 2 protein [Candidatus Dormibacteraeota bacterium]|jgi:glycosyltransferase involved in cell wall biosynthesis